jgi:HEAT repeat protein
VAVVEPRRAPNPEIAPPLGRPVVIATPYEAARPETSAQVAPLLDRLRSSNDPAERERAVNLLAVPNGQPAPEVAAALINSASRDSSPAVRAGCLRALVRLKVRDGALPGVVSRLQADSDPRVRVAAAELKSWLQGGQAARDYPTLRIP